MFSLIKQYFEIDGIVIFSEDYDLVSKIKSQDYEKNIADTIDNKQQLSIIRKIIKGDKFYQIICCQNENDKYFNQNIYNIYTNKLIEQESLWECVDSYEVESIFRELLSIGGINIREYNRIIATSHYKVDRLRKKYNYNEGLNLYINGDYYNAFRIFKNSFEQGYSDASGMLGLCYFEGQGIFKNYNKALFYLSYPQKREKEYKDVQLNTYKNLIELQERAQLSTLCCLITTIITLLFICISSKNIILTGVFVFILILAIIIFISSLYKKYIYNFSYWYLVISLIFMSMLIV